MQRVPFPWVNVYPNDSDEVWMSISQINKGSKHFPYRCFPLKFRCLIKTGARSLIWLLKIESLFWNNNMHRSFSATACISVLNRSTSIVRSISKESFDRIRMDLLFIRPEATRAAGNQGPGLLVHSPLPRTS